MTTALVMTAACSGGTAATSKPAEPVVVTALAQTAEPIPTVEPSVTASSDAGPEPELRLTDSRLGIVDLREGKGPEAQEGAWVTVHYVGTHDDGRVFDSSRKRDQPFRFELGGGLVIAGWDEGVVGMRVGGLRRLIVPPHLAYGERGQAPIGPNAIIEFEIELLSLEPAPDETP